MNLSPSHPKWPLLIEGTLTHNFKAISGSLLISRLAREYKRDPTPARMARSIDEAVAFFQKYQDIFQDDLNQLFR